MKDSQNYHDLGYLASSPPPSRFNLFMARTGHILRHGHPDHSMVCSHDNGLRKHKDELLGRKDLRPDVRTYIEEYCL